MEENLNETNEINEAETKGPVRLWIENFWYHYKWHSIVSIFIVFIITVCSLQMCRKTDYDVHFLYGGGKYISRTSEDGNFCEFEIINSSLQQITKDYDENGHITPNFYDLYLLSEEELKEVADKVNPTTLYYNNQEFRNIMFSSNFYICFLSEDLYREYAKTEGVFAPIKPYTDNRQDLDYLDECAVYLHSSNLPFNRLPGICDFPENTVICLKSKTAFSASALTSTDKEQFARSEESLKALFNYGR